MTLKDDSPRRSTPGHLVSVAGTVDDARRVSKDKMRPADLLEACLEELKSRRSNKERLIVRIASHRGVGYLVAEGGFLDAHRRPLVDTARPILDAAMNGRNGRSLQWAKPVPPALVLGDQAFFDSLVDPYVSDSLVHDFLASAGHQVHELFPDETLDDTVRALKQSLRLRTAKGEAAMNIVIAVLQTLQREGFPIQLLPPDPGKGSDDADGALDYASIIGRRLVAQSVKGGTTAGKVLSQTNNLRHISGQFFSSDIRRADNARRLHQKYFGHHERVARERFKELILYGVGARHSALDAAFLEEVASPEQAPRCGLGLTINLAEVREADHLTGRARLDVSVGATISDRPFARIPGQSALPAYHLISPSEADSPSGKRDADLFEPRRMWSYLKQRRFR